MNILKFFSLCALALGLVVTPVWAQGSGENDVLKHVINDPKATTWQVYGGGETHELRKDAATPIKSFMHVKIDAIRANPWDVGAIAPVNGAIKKGDKINVWVWARLDSAEATKGPLYITLQQAQSPWAQIVGGEITVTSEWDMYSFEAVAQADYPAGSANLGVHLGKLTLPLQLGPPVVLLNYTPPAE